MSTGSQKTDSSPWAPQGAQFQQLYQRAGEFLDQPREYYPDSRIANRSPYELEASSNIVDMVRAGSPERDAARDQIMSTVAGDYLTPETNPYLRGVGDAAAEDITRQYQRAVMPGIASRFAGSGRSAGVTGGPNAESAAMADAQRGLGQELSQMYSSLYSSHYGQERDRQLGAVGAVPGFRESEFGEQAALSGVGRDDFQYQQLRLNDLVDRFNFGQNEFLERLSQFQSLISGPAGYGTQEQTGKIGTAQMIGMGMSAGMGAAGAM